MRIGEVAERAGVSVRSLRYYEQQGLIESTRTSGGQRRYGEDAVSWVGLIQQLYAAGLSSATIRELMPCLQSGVSTPESRVRLREEKARLDEYISGLERTRERLEEMIELAETPNPHCPVVLG
ncbi:MerR family transcriptional regulator [Amycolatopsis echigonensis]|uniref:DNA-binding transcriptional MerR regulator n=1 Tax=Amycolatopsis echigonensis TaxID=2576905 RepID=A0A2N3WFX5_9PSEU|nr:MULTISPECIES: MerR family transcriptional regulator [Amycolatopsis]MBB2497848.1 MerR family transcriptional regulator [Amycolatopsis echigonensis]PKV92766.1 DNA-binding transcriptional MerR regulator [Amycolatopsis niigatensis]